MKTLKFKTENKVYELTKVRAKVYCGEEAKKLCNNILANGNTITNMFSTLIPGYDIHSVGYWKDDNGRWIAYDNTTEDCWVEEFTTYKHAINWITGRGAMKN